METDHIDIDRLLSFLSALPSTSNVRDWILQFKDGLRDLLSIDRVSLNINFGYELKDVERRQIALVVGELLGAQFIPANLLKVDSGSQGEDPSLPILHMFIDTGMPLDRYQRPIIFNYYSDGDAYLASLFLWKNRRADPIPATTIDLLDRIRPLLVVLFSGLVARYYSDHPVEKAFTKGLIRMSCEMELTEMQNRVVIHLLYGYGYDAIAGHMNISVNTVRHHIKKVYEKAGIHTLSELYAKFFIPAVHLIAMD